MSDTFTAHDNPNQLVWNDEFTGLIVGPHEATGRYSIRGLTRHDLRCIQAALSMQLTHAVVDANKPAPHWWNDGPDGGDHRIWFESHARYYREALAVFEKAGIT